MAVGLGRVKEDEIEKDLHKVSQSIKGESGIMFTNESVKTIKKFV